MMRIRGKKGNRPKPLIGEELFQVVEVQVTTGVLLLDGPPNPLEESSVDDGGAVRLANPPVSSATNLPVGETMVEPESPLFEKEPVSLSYEKIGTSRDSMAPV